MLAREWVDSSSLGLEWTIGITCMVVVAVLDIVDSPSESFSGSVLRRRNLFAVSAASWIERRPAADESHGSVPRYGRLLRAFLRAHFVDDFEILRIGYRCPSDRIELGCSVGYCTDIERLSRYCSCRFRVGCAWLSTSILASAPYFVQSSRVRFPNRASVLFEHCDSRSVVLLC